MLQSVRASEITLLFRGRVIFKQYIKKTCSGIRFFKLCGLTGYTYDMKVYLGRNWPCTTQDVTVTHVTVLDLTRWVEWQGHEFLFFCWLVWNWTKRKIKCCGNVGSNRKGMPWDLGQKSLRLIWGHLSDNCGWYHSTDLEGQNRCAHVHWCARFMGRRKMLWCCS